MKILQSLKKYTKCLAASLAVTISITAIVPELPKPGTPSEYSVCGLGDDDDEEPFPMETIPME
ncbi:MAG: hypothetical protein K2O03_00325 [Lachnospiraceae bacterium]|nr:hypothetical protein [Lachnospiraceae bacterium]